MNEVKIQFFLLGVYFFLLLSAIDYDKFGLKRPLFFNFFLAFTVAIIQFISIIAFVLTPNLGIGTPAAPALILLLIYPVSTFPALMFKRHNYGYWFVLAAFALSLYSAGRIYSTVDNERFTFESDYSRFNRVMCSSQIANFMEFLEKAKAATPDTSEIAMKKFPDMIFDKSSEIYIYLHKNFNMNIPSATFDMPAMFTQKTELSKFFGIYKLEKRKHNFYTRGGKFKDIVIYCDDIPSAEIISALEKAKEKAKAGAGK